MGLLTPYLLQPDEQRSGRRTLLSGYIEDGLNRAPGIRADGTRENVFAPLARQAAVQTLPPEPEEVTDDGPRGFGKILDVLARGQYASAALVDVLTNSEQETFTEASSRVFGEFFDPKLRMSYHTILERQFPDFVKDNPITATVMGIVGDIAFDPITYLTFGSGSAVRLTTKGGATVLAEAGRLRRALKAVGGVFDADDAERLAVTAARGMKKDDLLHDATQLAEFVDDRHKQILDGYNRALEGVSVEWKAFQKDANVRAVQRVYGLDEEDARRLVGAGLSAQQKAAIEPFVEQATLSFRGNAAKKLDQIHGRFSGELREHNYLSQDFKLLIDNRVRARFDETRKLLSKPRTPEARVGARQISTYERQIGELLENPEFRARVERKAGVGFEIPFTSVGTPRITYERLAEITGGKRVMEKLRAADTAFRENKKWYDNARSLLDSAAAKGSTWGKAVRNLFDRDYELPDEYKRLRKHFEAEYTKAINDTAIEYRDVFVGVSKESAEKIGKMLHSIDDMTGRAIKEGASESTIQRQATRMVDEAALTAEERAVYLRFRSRMADMQEVESAAGLLEHTLKNYVPRIYDGIKDTREFLELRRQLKSGLSEFFSPGQKRLLATLEAAEHAGLRPIEDAGVLYAMRVLMHRRVMARKEFNRGLQQMFPGLKVDNLGKIRTADFAEIAKNSAVKGLDERQIKRLLKDITYVGEGLYADTAEELLNPVLRGYDKLMGMFRTSATVFRPSFGPRQAVSNFVQSNLALGFSVQNTLRFMDPRTFTDATLGIWGGSERWALRTGLGEYIDGAQFARELRENGIIRNMAVEGIGGTTSQNWLNKVEKFVKSERKVLGKDREKLRRFMQRTLKYTDVPGTVEDFSRAVTYANARRAGHSAEQAAKIVDEALFDYAHGLSSFEQRFMRRIVPFYSFQRFAYPLMARTLAKTPGRVTATGQVIQGTFDVIAKAFGDEELTESERAALPGWILEQPSVVRGFNDQMRLVANTFNNFTPLDVMALMSSVDEREMADSRPGEFRWLEKQFLAQLTPFVKVPVESFFTGRQSFTGRSFANEKTGATKWNLHELDEDSALDAIAATLVGAGGGSAYALLATVGLGEITEEATPEVVQGALKLLLGWERRVNPETGKEESFVNAYRVNALSSMFPGLNELFRLGTNDERITPLQRTTRFLFGIGTFSLDLEEERSRRLRELQRGTTQRVGAVRSAARAGLPESFDEAMADLQDYQKHLLETRGRLLRTPVRGPSLLLSQPTLEGSGPP